MLAAVAVGRAVKNVGMQAVDDEASLLFILHQTGVTQNAEMVRNVDNLGVEQGRQLADVAAAVAQAVNDPQPLWVCQGMESAGAASGLQWLVHETVPYP